MVDAKITELADLPTPIGADLFVMVDDVSGTPITKKATLTNVQAVIDHDSLTNTHNNPYELDEIANPAGDTTFTMANKQIKFVFSAPTDNAFEIDITGGFSGDGFHVHQHGGNPGATHLVHFEAEDVDVLPLCVTHANGNQLRLSNVVGSIETTFKVDSSHDLTIDPSSTGKVIINSAFDVQGNITTTGTVDGIDIATDVAANTSKVSYTKTNVKGHIEHGGTAGTGRPSGFTSVEWIGTVEPSNAVNGDTWIDTT